MNLQACLSTNLLICSALRFSYECTDMHKFTCVNSGCRWPNIGKAPAFSTLCGQFEGPGPINVLCGKSRGRSRLSGGGIVTGADDIHLNVADVHTFFSKISLLFMHVVVSERALAEDELHVPT